MPTSTYHHGNLRAALIQAARELLADGRDSDPSLREVARKAGVSHAAPYRHFASFEELREEVAAAVMRDLATSIRAAAKKSGDDPEKALRAAAAAYVRYQLTHPGEAKQFIERNYADVPPDSPALAAGTDALTALGEILHGGQQAGVFVDAEIDVLVKTCWALVHGLHMFVTMGKLERVSPNKASQLIEPYLDLLLSGISKS
ncbi:TetR/AcrR family transcriptional regulator [Fodinicola acaciae]|uniref:TetR/AcrR family transcriptional regulator n=1 Tax=Fodinicola acaciae TaxID=2681555 RepID=UPI0013D28C57|nr:TetR/AcrR family transcriptional regulator [Fodinicola acaciae]